MDAKRQQILSEIRRTAEANAGVPLGRDRFEKETGIGARDWEGRYWARWSDAVAEAGFNPNKMNTAYSDGVVFERYVAFIRKLGRMPVNNEMKIAARNGTLPNPKTITAHFGRAAQVRARLRDYCIAHSGHDDILAILDEDKLRLHTGEAVTASPSPAIGSVYLVKSGRHYKIGRSNAAGRRRYEIDLQLPERTTMFHEIQTDDPEGIERYWHGRFANRRKNGEWFLLSADDVAAFRRRRFM